MARLQQYNPGDILCIRWEDSATEANSLEWMGGKDLKDALASDLGVVECHTVGFFVHQSLRALTVCQNITDSNCVSHVIHIPVAAILNVDVLVEAKKDDQP